MTKTVSASATLGIPARTAQREPVTVPGDRTIEYDAARDRVMVAVRAMQRTALDRGLTEEELARLVP